MPKFLKLLKPLIFIALFIGLGLLLKQLFPIFKIKQVNCQLNSLSCPAPLEDALADFQGKSLFFDNIEQRVQALNLELYQLESVNKSLPHTLNLVFLPKKNSYLLLKDQTQLLVVAENGVALDQEVTQKLPEIKIEGWPNEVINGHQVDPVLHQTISQLILELELHQIPTSNITVFQPTFITIELPENRIALIESEQIKTQIKRLAAILQEYDFNSSDTPIKEIDVRFKLPVLRTTRSTPS